MKLCPFCGKRHEWEQVQNLTGAKAFGIRCSHVTLIIAADSLYKDLLTVLWESRPIEDGLRGQIKVLERMIKLVGGDVP